MSWPNGMKVVLIVLVVVGLSQQRSIKEADPTPFELDDFLNLRYAATGWNGSWVSDTAFIHKSTDGNILKYDMTTRSSEIFLKKAILDKYPDADITVSPDLFYVLFRYDVSAIFRHSTTAIFTIYDIVKDKYYDIANKAHIELVTFAPKGHGLVYVLDNNIYYLDNFSNDIQPPVTVTTAGILGTVYCGVPDWVYEEEVLSSGSALWFSPDGVRVAYAVFHDEEVRNLSYTVYGEPGSLDYQYPSEVVIRYPKVGTANPIVSVYVFDTVTETTIEFQLPSTISNKEPNNYILYGLSWISQSEVAMISSNRVQNESIIIRCFINGSCHEETSRQETQGWLKINLPTYNKDGLRRLEILPQPEGDDRYDHLVLTYTNINKQVRLTSGKINVLSIDGWDEDLGIIYYTATSPNTPSGQNVYAIVESGKIECITCSMIVEDVSCGYGKVSLSKSHSYYIKQCLGPNVPLIVVENVKNVSDSLIWEDNSKLRAALALKSRPVIKNLVVGLTDKFSARVRLLLPPNLNENSLKQYPAIVNTYAGPGSNQINDAYNIGFQTYLVTNREYIYILIDGRGSDRDGYNKLFQMYRKFGTVEVEDQIQVTKYLQEHLPYIDAERTAIWGWSYGGFCSSWALAKDKDNVFRAALSVAPVTNFIYYDSIYTERFMGLPTPKDNEEGYKNTDLSSVVEAFRGRNYFIIHGTGDDNVHYQNSMLLVKALELADVEFRQHSYPDENHSLGHVSRHLYHMMDNYWTQQFRVENASSWEQKEYRTERH